jgi:hypothetical protein
MPTQKKYNGVSCLVSLATASTELCIMLYADHAYSQLHAADVSKDHMLTLLAQADAEKAEAQSIAATTAKVVSTSIGASRHTDQPQPATDNNALIVKQLQEQLEVNADSCPFSLPTLHTQTCRMVIMNGVPCANQAMTLPK